MFRFFQAMGFGAHYLKDFNSRYRNVGSSFQERRRALLDDRYGASHILKPVYDSSPDAFFTVCDDPVLQIKWAREHGLNSNNLAEILIAQIEEHNSEVFYNNHPIRFPSSFVSELPGSVKRSIAWRAAPSGVADLSAYDAIVSNFESLNVGWRQKGWKSLIFHPSWDPEALPYSENKSRSTDVFFAGSYARTTGHDGRLDLLNTIASLSGSYKVDLRLLYRKWGRLMDRPPWRWIPVPVQIPKSLRAIVEPPVFGREMYKCLSNTKIVINPATDIAGDERGNMRCWEALGCGTCMLASAGRYPEGFEAGVNFEAFTDTSDMLRKLESLLTDEPRRVAIADAGSKMLAKRWSKNRQWEDFKALLG